MKNLTVTLLLSCILPLRVQAQDGTEFDFWVGEWDLTWEYADGSQGTGTNLIEKILDGKVLQEKFEATDSGPYAGFKGTSISVFNPQSKSWHQAWADNQGGYFDFQGIIADGKRIFQMSTTAPDGTETLLRMRFYNIEENSLTWDWEQSKDGGESWTLSWRINYQRKP